MVYGHEVWLTTRLGLPHPGAADGQDPDQARHLAEALRLRRESGRQARAHRRAVRLRRRAALLLTRAYHLESTPGRLAPGAPRV
ncbi:hypothetical protein GCM10028864_17880 [Microlunatus parietis]